MLCLVYHMDRARGSRMQVCCAWFTMQMGVDVGWVGGGVEVQVCCARFIV